MAVTVDEYILDIEPEEIQSLAIKLREIIKEVIPLAEEAVKWHVPYYSYHGALCYINPHSDKISLGFAKGMILSNAQGILRGEGELKQVRYIYFYPGEELPKQTITEILSEAAMINEFGMK